MAHYTGFYVIEVGVCKTNRIACDPIVKVISVPAQLKNHYSGDTRECIYPPGLDGQGLFPGVWQGMWIIRPSDAKLREAIK